MQIFERDCARFIWDFCYPNNNFLFTSIIEAKWFRVLQCEEECTSSMKESLLNAANAIFLVCDPHPVSIVINDWGTEYSNCLTLTADFFTPWSEGTAPVFDSWEGG